MTVDWSHLAKNPLYPWSALSAKFVGKQIAKLLDSCTKTYGVGRDRMHLIGHSLGAQAMGYAGRFLDSDVHRITGMLKCIMFYTGILSQASRERLCLKLVLFVKIVLLLHLQNDFRSRSSKTTV